MCTWFCETFCCFLLRFRLYVLRKLGRGSSDHPDSPRSFEDIHLESVSSRLPPARVHPRSEIGSTTTTTVRMESPRRYQPAYPHATSSLQPEEIGGRPAAPGSRQNTAHPLDTTDPRSRSRTPRPQLPPQASHLEPLPKPSLHPETATATPKTIPPGSLQPTSSDPTAIFEPPPAQTLDANQNFQHSSTSLSAPSSLMNILDPLSSSPPLHVPGSKPPPPPPMFLFHLPNLPSYKPRSHPWEDVEGQEGGKGVVVSVRATVGLGV